ncbi:MAG: Txe/YoeB family addiction module toxin [Flavobacteriaceae bacterium]|jgi:toxin YoeB|nr:Txe/YoeB family addiction module toxin [Flavobacteriaceae bacterium]MBL4569524.1 Txe/YoeB family addiction module toxin [Flavobacteriaceae bacterium]
MNTKKKLANEVDKQKVIFTDNGWEDYQYWRKNDPAKFKKINDLIEASQISLHTGIGKPEKLSSNLKGYYSRRIDLEHRLVYKGDGKDLIIFAARYHY